jgi:hypothetical protein
MTLSEAPPRRWPAVLALAAVVGALALQLHLVILVNVNWDEFQRLARVHELARGEPMRPLQSAWTHAFVWLVRVPGDEVAQVIAGRLAAFAAELVALAGVYRLARRFVPPTDALYAVLTLLTAAYVLHHGFAFRSDAFVVALGLWGVELAFAGGRPMLLRPAAAGALFALALLVSLKAALYLLPLGGILLAAAGERRAARVVAFATSLAATFGVLCAVHAAGLPPPPSVGASGLVPLGPAAILRAALLSSDMPGWGYLAASARQSPLVWVGLVGGLAVAVAGARRAATRPAGLVLLALASPLVAFAVYRNTFPYFYLFALAPAAPLAGVFLARLRERTARRSAVAAAFVAAMLWTGAALTLATHYARRAQDQIAPQRELVRVVHALFPQPVPYVDRCSMIASYPKVGFFMTGWGMQRYRAGGPMIEAVLRDRQPVFLLANSPGLWLHLPEERARQAPYALFAEDRRLLRENFVHHWGLLWVAGKEVVFPPGATSVDLEILIPGTYTLEAPGAVAIDGESVAPGGTLRLAAGVHHAERRGGPRGFRLRWGERLPRPAHEPSQRPLFTGF